MESPTDEALASRLDVTFGSRGPREQDIRSVWEESTGYLLDVTFGANRVGLMRYGAQAHRGCYDSPQAVRHPSASAATRSACHCELPPMFSTDKSFRGEASSPSLSAASTDSGSSPGAGSRERLASPSIRKCQNCDSRADWTETCCQICGESFAKQTNFIGIMHSSASNSNLPVIVEPLHQFSRVKVCPHCRAKADWNAKACQHCGQGSLVVEEKRMYESAVVYSGESRAPITFDGHGGTALENQIDENIQVVVDERLRAFLF